MNRSNSLTRLLTLFALSLSSTLAEERVLAADSFEREPDRSLWRFEKLAPGAAVIQGEHVRKGTGALAITLRANDPSPKISAGDTERDELQEVDRLNTKEGETHEYRFSMLIPPDFPIVDKRLVIAQWKQDAHRFEVKVDNPVVALRYISGELFATVQDGFERRVIGRLPGDIRGRWLDLVVRIRHSRTDGLVRIDANGVSLANYEGPTAYAESLGYPPKATFYFKMGLYRDDMEQPMTIYIDEYSKTLIPEKEPTKA